MTEFHFRVDPSATSLSGTGTEADPYIIPTGYASQDLADVQSAISAMCDWAGEDDPDFDICQPVISLECEGDDACACTGVIIHELCEPPFQPPVFGDTDPDEGEDQLPVFPDFWTHMVAGGRPGGINGGGGVPGDVGLPHGPIDRPGGEPPDTNPPDSGGPIDQPGGDAGDAPWDDPNPGPGPGGVDPGGDPPGAPPGGAGGTPIVIT